MVIPITLYSLSFHFLSHISLLSPQNVHELFCGLSVVCPWKVDSFRFLQRRGKERGFGFEEVEGRG